MIKSNFLDGNLEDIAKAFEAHMKDHVQSEIEKIVNREIQPRVKAFAARIATQMVEGGYVRMQRNTNFLKGTDELQVLVSFNGDIYKDKE